MVEAYNLMKSRGSYVDAGLFLGEWMKTSPDLADVQYHEILTPIGPWKRGEIASTTERLLPAYL